MGTQGHRGDRDWGTQGHKDWGMQEERVMGTQGCGIWGPRNAGSWLLVAATPTRSHWKRRQHCIYSTNNRRLEADLCL